MFSFLDSCTSFCAGEEVKAQTPSAEVVKAQTDSAAVSAPASEALFVLENEAESTHQEHGIYDAVTKAIVDAVDPMDASNYLVVHLTRPMGILFEENLDDNHGGAFIARIMEGCSAAVDGLICPGDQLVAIGTRRVSGMDFDEIMKIIEESDSKIKLTIFRGPAGSLYGPLANVEWLDEFVAERGEEAELLRAASAAEVFDVVSETVKAELFNDVAAAVLDEVRSMDNADEKLVDAQPNTEEESATEENLVVVEDEVEVEEVVNSEAIPESTATEAEEDDVATEEEGDDRNIHSETEANLAEGAVPVEDEVELDGKIEDEVGNMDKADEKLADVETNVDEEFATEDKLVVVEDEVEVEAGEKLLDAEADVEEESTTEEKLVIVEDVVAVEEGEKLVDAEADVEEEPATEDKLVVVEDEVAVAEGNNSEAVPESTATEVEEVVVLDNDVVAENEGDERNVHSETEVLAEDEVELDGKTECEADLEKDSDADADADEALVVIENEVGADVGALVETDEEKGTNATNEALKVVESEVGADEKVDDTADHERKSVSSEESLVIVEHEVEGDEELSCELAQETAPTLNAINTANNDLLDDTASEPVSTALASDFEKNA